MAKKNPAAVALGRKGGKAWAAKLSEDELSEAGKRAISARWVAYYASHPEKLRAKHEREAIRAAGELKRGRPPKRR